MLFPLLVAAWCLISWPTPSLAQNGNVAYPENAIDSRLRTEARVDPTTGAMQLQITLGNYPGRAGAGVPVTLYYSSKLWRLEHQSTVAGAGGVIYPQDSIYGAYYGDASAAGWTSNLDWFLWPGGETPIQTYDSQGRAADGSGSFRVARMFVRLPDGSKHELRRDDNVTHVNSYNGGGVYYAVDGSRLKYDTANQTLYLPDGSRYIGDTQYVDRHGNTLSYNSGQWRDTLDRAIGLPLPSHSTIGEGSQASARDQYFSVPGVGGSIRFGGAAWPMSAPTRVRSYAPRGTASVIKAASWCQVYSTLRFIAARARTRITG